MERNKKLKFLIVILAVLFGISATALTGTLLYHHFSQAKAATVDIPGNIITPDGESGGDAKGEEAVGDPSDSPQPSLTDKPDGSADSESLVSSVPEPSAGDSSPSQRPQASLDGSVKANALSLYTKQPEENKPFQAANMFPGDSEVQYFRIKVSYKGDITVRYHADIRSGYEKLAEVLKIKVRLLGAEEILYDGLMRDMPKSLDYALHTNTQKQSELYYELTAYLDTSVGNEYMDKELIADFRWWVEETENLDVPPQTGDAADVYLWGALCAGSILCLLILIAKRRKEAADETE